MAFIVPPSHLEALSAATAQGLQVRANQLLAGVAPVANPTIPLATLIAAGTGIGGVWDLTWEWVDNDSPGAGDLAVDPLTTRLICVEMPSAGLESLDVGASDLNIRLNAAVVAFLAATGTPPAFDAFNVEATIFAAAGNDRVLVGYVGDMILLPPP